MCYNVSVVVNIAGRLC